MVRRVFFIAEYRYGENSAANTNFNKSFEHFKSLDIGLKNAFNIFQKNPKICFLGGKSPKFPSLI
jgi:hypothetical protein